MRRAVAWALALALAGAPIAALAQGPGSARPIGEAPNWAQTPAPAPATPAASAPTAEQSRTPAAAKPAAAMPPPTETPTPTQTEAPPPYEPQLLRLAELIGALAYLRDLCGDGDGAAFRDKMASLVDTEGTTEARKESLAGAFNRGFRDYELTYRACTPIARDIVVRFLDEASRIAKDVANRYSG